MVSTKAQSATRRVWRVPDLHVPIEAAHHGVVAAVQPVGRPDSRLLDSENIHIAPGNRRS